MLKVIQSVHELDFNQLMRVYEESNRMAAQASDPQFDVNSSLLQVEQDFYIYLRDVFFRTERALYAVWEQNGRYVSALRLEPYRNGLLLEALETAPGDRCMGYASQLVMAVIRLVRSRWKCCIYAHVDKANLASVRVHRQCGFKRIQEHAAYIDGSVSNKACTFCLWGESETAGSDGKRC